MPGPCSGFFRRTLHPVIVTIRGNRDYVRVLVYSLYTAITGWGVRLRDSVFSFGGMGPSVSADEILLLPRETNRTIHLRPYTLKPILEASHPNFEAAACKRGKSKKYGRLLARLGFRV